MEQIISIANDFYTLNDIKINGDKSEIIVINADANNEELTLKLGSDRTLVTANNPDIASRYLGVYIKGRNGTSHINTLLQQEVNDCVALLCYSNTNAPQLLNWYI